jgi:hypothetical protein
MATQPKNPKTCIVRNIKLGTSEITVLQSISKDIVIWI